MADNKNIKQRDYAMPATNFAMAKLMVRDMNRNYLLNRSYNTKYDRKQILTYLENPQVFEQPLRDVSNYLYSKSMQYKRIVHYFAKLGTLDYIIEPSKDISKMNKAKVKSQYQKVVDYVSLLNIKHEFINKVLVTAWREDAFYGYEMSTDESYFILPLDGRYCRITSIEDGCFNFAFDFSYFQRDVYTIQMYPVEFQERYIAYTKGEAERWQELDSDRTICIKIMEDTTFVVPPFSGIMDSLFDIDMYKDLRKDSQIIQNYKVLVQKLPMKKDSDRVNDFMIDFDTMMMFHNKAAEALPDQVALITTPMDVTSENFEKGSSTIDNVANSIKTLYDTIGVSRDLFNADSSTGIGIDYSVKTDEQLAFAVNRQIERWINRKLKKKFKNTPFRINILDISIFNRDQKLEDAIEAAPFGFPTKLVAGAIMGLAPSSIEGLAFLENEVLNLNEQFVPLQSAHTMSDPNDEGGRPLKKSGQLGKEGVKKRDNGGNATQAKKNK